jgi:hypothetical protein
VAGEERERCVAGSFETVLKMHSARAKRRLAQKHSHTNRRQCKTLDNNNSCTTTMTIVTTTTTTTQVGAHPISKCRLTQQPNTARHATAKMGQPRASSMHAARQHVGAGTRRQSCTSDYRQSSGETRCSQGRTTATHIAGTGRSQRRQSTIRATTGQPARAHTNAQHRVAAAPNMCTTQTRGAHAAAAQREGHSALRTSSRCDSISSSCRPRCKNATRLPGGMSSSDEPSTRPSMLSCANVNAECTKPGHTPSHTARVTATARAAHYTNASAACTSRHHTTHKNELVARSARAQRMLDGLAGCPPCHLNSRGQGGRSHPARH